jgi:hypothetical protein
MTRLLVFGSRSWSTTPKGKRPTAAGMLAICKRAGTPVIVYREDGVEP